LKIIDRIFYYFGYLQYFTIKYALSVLFDSSTSQLLRVTCIVLFPITFLGFFSLLILVTVFEKYTVDLADLRWENKKFLNNLVSDENSLFITDTTKFIWRIYNSKIVSHCTERIDDSIIDKIMHIFQHGMVTLNAVDLNDILKTMTDKSTTHYEGFVEKQLNQQVTQIVDMISKANELSQERNDEKNKNLETYLGTSSTITDKLNQLHSAMIESQSDRNNQVKDMTKQTNQLQNKIDVSETKKMDRLQQLEQKMEVSEQKNMDRLQQLEQKMEVSEQKNMDRLQQLEQKMEVLEQKNMDRLQQLEQKMDAFINFLKDKLTN
jgi:hypothetical protein